MTYFQNRYIRSNDYFVIEADEISKRCAGCNQEIQTPIVLQGNKQECIDYIMSQSASRFDRLLLCKLVAGDFVPIHTKYWLPAEIWKQNTAHR